MIGMYNSTKFHTAVETCNIFYPTRPSSYLSGEDILTAHHRCLHPSTAEQSFSPGLGSGRCGRRTVDPNLVAKTTADAERSHGSLLLLILSVGPKVSGAAEETLPSHIGNK